MREQANQRLRVVIRGTVQGVGFRPFIYRLATGMGLPGWVINSAQGVFIEVEGPRDRLGDFLLRIEPEKPPQAAIHSLESSFLDLIGFERFEIRESTEYGEKTAVILPDLATCTDCAREILDPGNRRYRYPFTNCTNCGPRFSIIESLPYDRPNTSMKHFVMCEACRSEYENPLDRRFHAQPNACSVCGPRLSLWDGAGRSLCEMDEALVAAAQALKQGKVVAVKGIGGFHLMVGALEEEWVLRLRAAKQREEKPFALMFPSMESIEAVCEVAPLEARLLTSPESPIVLLRRRCDEGIAHAVAPRNPYLGVMLPYTPLHRLLLSDVGMPVVATSGNLSDEPICTDAEEAVERLAGIADLFLVHDRPIVRHVDDSIVRVLMGRELVLRRARGYAPLPVHTRADLPPILAVGAHLKNAVAVTVAQNVFQSQHIGDLETADAYDAFRRVAADLQRLYDITPAAVACDLHPNYLSTQYAQDSGLPVVAVQHHYAHGLSCMAENEIEAPALAVSWDGTGYGADGTVWGGEFLRITDSGFERAAHLRTFRLPGGDRAVKEPRRSALGVLWELGIGAAPGGSQTAGVGRASRQEGEGWFSVSELSVMRRMLEQGINCPVASSAGRLIDAVASLVGLRQVTRYEGQSAMALEFALNGVSTADSYEFGIIEEGGRPMIVDWGPAILAVISDVDRNEGAAVISARFHNTLVEMIVAVARRVGDPKIVLSGGCFQNRYLTERAVARLREEAFRPYWHQRIPPNDGGIALGQAMAAARELR